MSSYRMTLASFRSVARPAEFGDASGPYAGQRVIVHRDTLVVDSVDHQHVVMKTPAPPNYNQRGSLVNRLVSFVGLVV